MSSLITLQHRTTYRYDRPVVLGPQIMRLRPAPHARTPILSYRLEVTPTPRAQHWFRDPQGNHLARVLFADPAARFEVTVELSADLSDFNPFDFVLEPEAVEWPFQYAPLLREELAPHLTAVPVRPWMASLIGSLTLVAQPSIELLLSLNQHVHGRIAYVTRLEPGIQRPEQTLQTGRGSCRDVAWLLVLLARNLGFAARFVSGYLIQLVDPDRPVPGLAADTADLHAWAEIYLPGAGWIGFDATSGLVAGAGHIPLASGTQPESAAPVSGTIEAGAEAAFDVGMRVTRQAAVG